MDAHRPYLQLINQLFDMQRKLKEQDTLGLMRNLKRMRESLEALGYIWHDPSGEKYAETRTDCDATFIGSSAGEVYIHEVIKPIVRFRQGPSTHIVQRAIVLVQSAPSS